MTTEWLIGHLRDSHFGTQEPKNDALYYAADDLEWMSKRIAELTKREAKLVEALEDWITYMDSEGYTDKQYKKGLLKQALKEIK